MGYYGSILSHTCGLCLCPSGPPTPHHQNRFAPREYCNSCIQPGLVPYGPTHPKKIKSKKKPHHFWWGVWRKDAYSTSYEFCWTFIGLTNHLVHSYRFSTRVLTNLIAHSGRPCWNSPPSFPVESILCKIVGTHNQTRCLQPLGRNPPSPCVTTSKSLFRHRNK